MPSSYKEKLKTVEPPRNWAVVLYDFFDVLDVAGSVELLALLASTTHMNLSLVAESMSPKWMRPESPKVNRQHSYFQLSLNPTHTFAQPPADIDVLFVPGGGGERVGNITAVVDFVRKTYPRVQHLITICTGAGIAARAGILDGRRATSNKSSWDRIVTLGNGVEWTSPARWVVDGNIWTSSGVVSGINLTLAFMEQHYGNEIVDKIVSVTEHRRTTDPCDDPFAALLNVKPSGRCK